MTEEEWREADRVVRERQLIVAQAGQIRQEQARQQIAARVAEAMEGAGARQRLYEEGCREGEAVLRHEIAVALKDLRFKALRYSRLGDEYLRALRDVALAMEIEWT